MQTIKNNNLWNGWDVTNWVTWLPTLVGPLISIILLITICLCILNALIKVIENTATNWAMAQVLALEGY